MGRHSRFSNLGQPVNSYILKIILKRRRRRKLALFMKRIINFQQMIRCREVLLRKDWRIINLLRVAGLQEDGPG